MKKNMMDNRKNNNNKLETAKSIATGIGEGLGVIALIGLTFAASYAEVEADERAEKRLYELDSKYYSLKREIDTIPISKFPYGYYNGIRSDFESIAERYDRIRLIINHYGLKNQTIDEIKRRYGYSFIDRVESDIDNLKRRIR